MRRSVTLFLMILSLAGWSQAKIDTVYFDRDWNKCSADTFTFRRLIQQERGHYWVRDFYSDGNLQMNGTYTSLDPEVEDGKFTYYFDSGHKLSEGTYRNGKKEGEYITYDSTGTLKIDAMYMDGEKNGKYVKYYPDGKVWRKEDYNKGKMIDGYCYDEKGKELSFYPESVGPEFVGGDMAMKDFVQEHLIYPLSARKMRIEGRVVVRFTITKEGDMNNIHVAKSDAEILNDAALKVVRQMPKWKPAMLEGKPVESPAALPIKFNLLD